MNMSLIHKYHIILYSDAGSYQGSVFVIVLWRNIEKINLYVYKEMEFIRAAYRLRSRGFKNAAYHWKVIIQ